MKLLMGFLQQVKIEKKLELAPNKAYEIGVFIGSMLPFLVLVILAYLLYHYNKKKNNK